MKQLKSAGEVRSAYAALMTLLEFLKKRQSEFEQSEFEAFLKQSGATNVNFERLEQDLVIAISTLAWLMDIDTIKTPFEGMLDSASALIERAIGIPMDQASKLVNEIEGLLDQNAKSGSGRIEDTLGEMLAAVKKVALEAAERRKEKTTPQEPKSTLDQASDAFNKEMAALAEKMKSRG